MLTFFEVYPPKSQDKFDQYYGIDQSRDRSLTLNQ